MQKQANLKNKPRIGNLTEKNKPNLRLVGKFKKHKTSRQIKYKKTEANPIKTRPNVQIYTKTRPNFVLHSTETAKVP